MEIIRAVLTDGMDVLFYGSKLKCWQRLLKYNFWRDEFRGCATRPILGKLLWVFRNNMRRPVSGTFNVYRALVKRYKIQLFLTSDHVSEIVPLLIMWHPEVFELIPREKRFWSCYIGLIKQDSDFFPYVLEILEEKFSIRKEEVLLIDDNKDNIKMAERMGIKAIRFRSAKQLKKELEKYGLKV